jgi:class 3 adenylate cyclase
VASLGDTCFLSRKEVREQIAQSFATARQGVASQTSGMIKLAESRLRGALHGERAPRGGLVSDLRARSRIGVNHKESLAVLAVDMRGSTALAEENEPDKMFIVMQCFIPLLAFVVQKLGGEVVGLRGDGLLAAFGFGDLAWRPCVNHAYEAGAIMIEAHRDELGPFLKAKSLPTARGIGVGVDCGRTTITKIGLGDAIEVTAYGSSVNEASKGSKLINKVWLSSNANRHLHDEDEEGTFTPKRTRLRQ